MRVAVLVALAGCYQAPARDTACTILCDSSCPDDMACVNGFCVADGDTCEPTFTGVRAGNGFACALDANGRRWCWGANDHHQIDSSDRTQVTYATRIDQGPWDALASGGDHACGLRGGELYCWGGNDHQQVSGGVIGDVAEPLRIASPAGAPWRFVSTGYNATCAIADRLYCWGAGDSGQLGNGSTGDVGVPTPVAIDLADWTSVSLGRGHTCAISQAAGLHCWGDNYYGAIGDGSALYSGTPVMMPSPVALPNVTAVAVARYSTCAVADAKLYCWGYPYSNVLGDPALTNTCNGPRNVPQLSSGLDGWTSVSASQYMNCGLRGDEVWCWGYSAGGGGLGKGAWANTGWGRVTQGATDVSVGWNANVDEDGDTLDLDLACAVLDGHVQCWGDNRFGQLAQGDATMHPTPQEIAGNHRWSTLVASDQHTCGITDAGELYCWGGMQSGQTLGTAIGSQQVPCGSLLDVPCTLGEPTRVPFMPNADAIGLGDDHTCALLGTTLTCWGSDGRGQLTGLASPATIPGTWTKLFSVGSAGQCAVQNGETWCWGAVTNGGQAPAHDARLDGISSIFVNSTIGDTLRGGSTRALGCALGATGQLSCFGVNTHGQFGTGPVPTAVCGNAVCELTENFSSCPGDCPGTQRTYTDSCGLMQTATDYARCGDGLCTAGYGETCSSCAADCGACPFTALGRTYDAFAVGMQSSSSFVCGVRPDGHIECWGRNGAGQVGVLDNTTGKPVDPVYTPAEVAGLASCTAVAAGDATSCAICGGDLYCWGSNRRGTLGAGALTATPITIPRKLDVTLEPGDRFVQLTAGTGYACARSEHGRGFCWGFHRYGALGTGSTSANLPVDIRLAPP